VKSIVSARAVPSQPGVTDRKAELAERVQSILASKQLSLYQVSRQSEQLYGHSSPYFIPHNLYYDLRSQGFRPSAYQIFALSRISGYRLEDWLRVFGFDLEQVSRMQLRLSPKRTMLLDSSLTNPGDWVAWFRNRRSTFSPPAIVPLGHLLEWAPPRRIDSLSEFTDRGFLYAKIGREDAFAFPDLLPGSIVRVRPARPEDLPFGERVSMANRIFLVEHSRGFCCCRIRATDHGLMPVSTLLSYAQVEFEHPSEIRILGVVDLEIRPWVALEEPEVPKDLARRWKPRPIALADHFGEVLRGARSRMRLSLRETAALSRSIADSLEDDRCYVSPSSLCDYEVLNTPPRDFRKIMTLCSIYGVSVETLLLAMGIAWGDAGSQSMPDHFRYWLTGVKSTAEVSDELIPPAGFFGHLLEQCREVPLFLRDSIAALSRLPQVSLDNFFWIDGERDPLHPYLASGLLAVVNRRRKTAVHWASRPPWRQPAYMILKRDGTYFAACCGNENGTLVIHPYAGETQSVHRPTQYRQHRDAEVIGQIVAVARRLE
jgi:hypothetical protein